MFEMREVFRNIITKRLADAPVGPAKGELIEELTDNLLCRYNDLVAAGVDPGEAETQALDALGDTNELVEYLKSLEPDEPLPEPDSDWDELMKNMSEIARSAMNQARNALKAAKDQLSENGSFHWKSEDGTVEIQVGSNDEWTAELEEKMSNIEDRMSETEDEISELEDKISDIEAELDYLQDELSDLQDSLEGSDAHAAAVEKRIASKQRRIAAKQAELDALNEELEQLREEYSELECEYDELREELDRQEDEDEDESVDIEAATDRVFQHTEKAVNAAKERIDAAVEKINAAAKKMEQAFKDKPFTVGVDVDNSGCSIGVNPHQKSEKDVIYGVGYDKEKGGFFAQWGEYKGGYNRPVEEGPVCSEALKGISVQTVSGDVTIRMTEDPGDDVIIDGDIDKLDVRRSDDGVLTITQGKTASSSFFFGRGLATANVILSLPRRAWEFLRVFTVSGDVAIEGDHEVALVEVKTTSGDLEGGLPRCGQLQFKSISGDLEWTGDVAQFSANTTSGDMKVTGNLGETQTASISGDVQLEGSVTDLACTSTSGDVLVRSAVQPLQLDVASRSGDTTVYIPANSTFTVCIHTAAGDFRSDFFGGPVSGREIVLSNNDEQDPIYKLTTTSGDIRLKKL